MPYNGRTLAPMRFRDLRLNLDGQSGATLARRISSAIQQAIRDGRLRPGDALPGSRALAEDLQVNRNTVITAIQELESEGWLESQPKRGTFVASTIPVDPPSAPAMATPGNRVGFDLPSRLAPITAAIPGALNLADGLADSRLAPTEEMAKAYQRALRRHGQDLLAHGEHEGNQLLRKAIAAWVSERHGVAVGAHQVLVTSGGRMGLELVCQALLQPGDRVGVEEPGNRAAWQILKKGGRADLLGLPVDRRGLCIETLEATLSKHPLRMLYLTPRRQFPTGTVLSPERAEALLALAAKHRVAIFEDDLDAEIQFEGGATLPLYARDRTGQVIFAGSFSRIVAPGLRIGYLVLPEALVAPLARLRRDLETQGDRALEWSVADLLRDGEVARHLRRVVRVYEQRRDALARHLRETLSDELSFDLPTGGMALWARTLRRPDPAPWLASAKEQGLVLSLPSHFFLGAPTPCFRFGFTQANEVELAEAAERLRRSLG